MDEVIQSFGACLRSILNKKSISAEELVKQMNQTGLVKTNKPAISRIINGKRIATDEEVSIIADVLESPLLLEAYNLYKRYKDTKEEALLLAFHEAADRIHYNEQPVQEERSEINYIVLFQLVKSLYKQCLGYDVSAQVKDGFLIKLYHVSGCAAMIERLRAMYLCFFHSESLSKSERAWIAAALLYFINPIDLIPDFIIPGGYSDDAIVTGFIFFKLSKVLVSYISKSKESNVVRSESIELNI